MDNESDNQKPEDKPGTAKPSDALDTVKSPKQDSFPYAELPQDINADIGVEWLDAVSKGRMVIADGRDEVATLIGEFYKTSLQRDRLGYLLKAVIAGDPKRVLMLLEGNPLLFFEKFKEITDPSGRTFFDVSAADLISFLGDDDMLRKIHDFAQQLEPDKYKDFLEQWQKHQASRGHGGADSMMITGDNEPEFSAVCEVTNTFNWSYNSSDETETTKRPLLTNPNGIVCRKSSDKQLHWYYANLDTKTLEPIKISKALGKHQAVYDALYTRMQNMEPNTPTAMRLSNDEHQFFETYAQSQVGNNPIKIHREGIHYQQDGIDYIDTHYDSNRLINAYFKCIRLYKASEAEMDDDDRAEELCAQADKVFLGELGYEQRGAPLWLLQRYCEEGRSFWKLADDYKETPFVRSLQILDPTIPEPREVLLFDVKSGFFSKGFGEADVDSGYAIHTIPPIPNVCRGFTYKSRSCGPTTSVVLIADLATVSRLVIDAHNSVNDFEPQVVPVAGPSGPHY